MHAIGVAAGRIAGSAPSFGAHSWPAAPRGVGDDPLGGPLAKIKHSRSSEQPVSRAARLVRIVTGLTR
jgi:hypothetical protein